MPTDTPPAVRKIVKAMVDNALARCDREGIRWEDFFRLLQEEQTAKPTNDLPEIFGRVFARFQSVSK